MSEEQTNEDVQDRNTDDAPGSDELPNGGGEEIKFTPGQQSKIDSIVEDRLKRAQAKWEADSEAAKRKAEQDTEQKRLKEQQEFQKLAEQHEAKLQELTHQLEAATKDLERYKGALTSHHEVQRKDLPAHILALLDKLDPVEQLQWLSENAETLGKKSAPRPLRARTRTAA